MKAVLIAFSLLLTSVAYAEHGHGGHGGYHHGGYHGGGHHGGYYGGGHHGYHGYYGGGYYNDGFGISINLGPGYGYVGEYQNEGSPYYIYDSFGNPVLVAPEY